eukprot:TRINITY_DN38520_c0_g1_i1.p1 TRINITY_DN38520_c0_g1~~TRINITY_DN38520_c0_g1_i1.p1  ORF type:complete len:541 (+),score=100.75 TRINITY_DN38520_c0_g1_i1:65-1624(+)
MAAAVCEPSALPESCFVDERILRLLELSCRLCPPLGDRRVAADGRLLDSPEEEEDGRTPSSSSTAVPSAEESSRVNLCLDHTQDDGVLADLAVALAMGSTAVQMCPVAFWAAYLITMQYAIDNRVLDIPAGLNASADASDYSSPGGFDLSPFPFRSAERSLGSQLVFHKYFLAAHHLPCDDIRKTGQFRGKFVLRAAHDKPEYHCAVRTSDAQLLRRCRERRRNQKHTGSVTLAVDKRWGMNAIPLPLERMGRLAIPPGSFVCPTEEEQAAFALRRGFDEAWTRRSDDALKKYTQRAAGELGQPGRGCEEPASEWRVDLGIFHKCVLVVILERLDLRPGAMVLDWGAGCGHKLTWASQLYDVQGLGLDIVGDNVRWAEQHSIGKFCRLDGRFVEWLPDDYFDAVISYAALMHLQPEDQCAVVTELVGKLRPGGKMWFGWNTPMINNMDVVKTKAEADREHFWSECFTKALQADSRWRSGAVAVMWETELEANLFPDDYTRVETYLYWPPAYSLFVTRLH